MRLRRSLWARWLSLPESASSVARVVACRALKVPRGKSAEATLADAMDQLAARRYADELRARGAGSVVEFGIVFDGKRAWVARRFA